MRLLFHSNQLCLRGTGVAMFDYALFNESILGNESFIVYDSRSRFNDPRGISKFANAFPNRVFAYENRSEINSICDRLNIDSCYMIKGGENDGLLTNRKNLVHVVFQAHQPHGDVYAYVSEWLSNKMTGGRSPYVPHMVHLPKPTGTVRKQLGIPSDAVVFGRYGGMDQFDIPFVKEAVIEHASANPDCWFMFMNTIPFANHPRILFIEGTSDLQLKSNFIESCDAMIHGRSMGESFGLAICEFLHGNKPVLAWNGGNDQHHIDILRECGTLYSDKRTLMQMMGDVNRLREKQYDNIVSKFSPSAVMNKFKMVFLEA
jgi:hypothetical protein